MSGLQSIGQLLFQVQKPGRVVLDVLLQQGQRLFRLPPGGLALPGRRRQAVGRLLQPVGKFGTGRLSLLQRLQRAGQQRRRVFQQRGAGPLHFLRLLPQGGDGLQVRPLAHPAAQVRQLGRFLLNLLHRGVDIPAQAAALLLEPPLLRLEPVLLPVNVAFLPLGLQGAFPLLPVCNGRFQLPAPLSRFLQIPTAGRFLLAQLFQLLGLLLPLGPQAQKPHLPQFLGGFQPPLVLPSDAVQGFQLLLLLLGQPFMVLIVPDGLLHGFNVGLFRDITDIFRDKLPDIHDGPEGYGLFQHPAHLVRMDIPLAQQFLPIPPVGIEQLTVAVGHALEPCPQRRNAHGLSVLHKAVGRNDAVIEKILLTDRAVVAAVEDDARHKIRIRLVVVKFTGNIGRKILAPAGFGAAVVHIGPEITLQRPLGTVVGGLVEVPGAGLTQQHNLQGVDDGGLARAVFAGEKVYVVDFNQLFPEVQPVHQQNPLQLLHPGPPLCRFAAAPRQPPPAPATPPLKWWAGW